jgi:peptide/nickel transport system permease protein
MTLHQFLLKRFMQALVVLVLIACTNFVIINAAPGDMVDVMAGESGAADEAYLAGLRQKFGLEKPMPVRLARYLGSLATLDLGFSFRNNVPVADLILSRFPATLLLMSTSLGLALVGGVILGVAAARRPGSIRDSAISILALLGYSTPLFWFGLMLTVLMSIKLGLLPSSGMSTIGAEYGAFGAALDVAKHLVMPAITLSLFYISTYTRLMRASMLEIFGMDFVRTAKAKGLNERQVAYRHVLRNAILPLVSLFGVQLGAVLGGSVVVEVVFGWPGLGTLAFDALFQRDYNLLMGILFMSSVLVVFVNLAVDLLYSWLDPRIEVGK